MWDAALVDALRDGTCTDGRECQHGKTNRPRNSQSSGGAVHTNCRDTQQTSSGPLLTRLRYLVTAGLVTCHSSRTLVSSETSSRPFWCHSKKGGVVVRADLRVALGGGRVGDVSGAPDLLEASKKTTEPSAVTPTCTTTVKRRFSHSSGLSHKVQDMR